MAGEKVVKRSCSFCVHEERDSLEEQMLQGMISAKQLDKDMGWRTNTSDRHYRNHMGEYHMASNTDCALCTTPIRGDYERAYFDDGSVSAAIAEERMRICASCPYGGEKRRCDMCGCGIKTKASLNNSKCPLKKWPSTSRNS